MIRNSLLIASLLLLFACKSNKEKIPDIHKNSPTDKFKTTMVGSQNFQINSSETSTIQSQNGNLIVIPKGAFIDHSGNEVEGPVKIELAEASELDEIILSNLVLQDSGTVCCSHTAFYINVTKNSEQLAINKQKPLYIELASDKPLSLYGGVRDSAGNMNWNYKINPVTYLTSVPLDLLNFLPKGFEYEVEIGMPYKGHQIATKELVDSLYYSFAFHKTAAFINEKWNGLARINLISPILSFLYQKPLQKEIEKNDSTKYEIDHSGINPASIKAIRNKKFQNTLISTRQFEARLQAIFETCNNAILELYINNLNKNLWEIDQLAAEKLGKSNSKYSAFMEFASYKQTSVKISDEKAEQLAKFYTTKKNKIEKELLKIKQELLNEKLKHQVIVEAKIEEYANLLEERHTYRMKKFGFELTQLGWYNAVEKINIKEVEKFELNVSIDNGKSYDRAYTYVVNPRIKSIFSLLSEDKIHFDHVYFEDPDLLLWKYQEFKIIGVGYQNEKIGYKIEEHYKVPIVTAKLHLENKTLSDFKKDIREFTKQYKKENSILVDLKYHIFFNEANKRIKREEAEAILIEKLEAKAFPCYAREEQVRNSFDPNFNLAIPANPK